MISFSSLTIKNFFSVEQAYLPLDVNGTVLVTGEVRGKASAFSSNGAGKTTLFNALVWGLFGRTIRDLPEDENVIRLGTDEASVTVELLVNDERFSIQRSRRRGKPSKLRVLNEAGEDVIVGSSVVQMSRFLEDRILHCSFDAFCNTVYFPQGSFTFFTQANDVERKKIFDRLLGTAEFVDWEKRAKTLKVTYENALDNAAATRKLHQSVMERDIYDRDRIPGAEQELARRRKNELENLGLEAVSPAAVQASLAKARKQEKAARAALEAGSAQMASRTALEARLNDLKAQQSAARDTYNKVYNKLTAVKALAEAGNCPTCFQDISPGRSKTAVKEFLVDVTARKTELDAIEAKVAEIVLPERVRVGDLRDDLKQIEAKVKDLEDELEAIKTQATDYEKAQAVVEARYQEGLANFQARTAALNERIESAQELIAGYDKEIAELTASVRQAAFWITGFGPKGIRSLIFENIMPYLNERANHYSSILTDGTIEINISATSKLKSGDEREKIFVSAVNSDGASVYEGNSGGERKRVDLCILLALQDLILNRSQGSIRLSVYDELLDELDEEGIERVVELLKERGQNQPVFLISHNAALKGFFEDTMVVVKRNGISKIESA